MEPDPPSDPSLMGHAPPSDPPPMEIIRYLCTDSPTKTWRSCAEYLERWKLEKLQKSVADSMVIFRREMALNLVMCSCKLKARPPENIGQEDGKIYKLLENIYNGTKSYKPDDSNVPECSEGDRYSERQRVQHLLAYKCLCESGLHEGRPLSEELIKETHETLMFKLLNDKSESIDAGTYRLCSVHVGEYVFPDASCVPENMEKIVSDYNMKFSQTHDPYQLATWLFFKVISLHPFKDGNGRLCRLLWCYSLMRDGLPFPLTYSSGHKKAYKHYVHAIEKSQTSKDHPYLTTLTVISICNAWKYFHDSVARH